MFHQLIENRDDFNQLPPPQERRGLFWQLASPLLGLQVPAVEDDGVTPEIAAMRRRDERMRALNAPAESPKPSVIEVVREVVAEVVEAVRPAAPRERAAALLDANVTVEVAVPSTTIERLARESGISMKTLRAVPGFRRQRVSGPTRGSGFWAWIKTAP